MQRVDKLISENGELGVNNVTLKVQVTNQLAHAGKKAAHKCVYDYWYEM